MLLDEGGRAFSAETMLTYTEGKQSMFFCVCELQEPKNCDLSFKREFTGDKTSKVS